MLSTEGKKQIAEDLLNDILNIDLDSRYNAYHGLARIKILDSFEIIAEDERETCTNRATNWFGRRSKALGDNEQDRESTCKLLADAIRNVL